MFSHEIIMVSLSLFSFLISFFHLERLDYFLQWLDFFFFCSLDLLLDLRDVFHFQAKCVLQVLLHFGKKIQLQKRFFFWGGKKNTFFILSSE